jgi:hypothetical protein
MILLEDCTPSDRRAGVNAKGNESYGIRIVKRYKVPLQSFRGMLMFRGPREHSGLVEQFDNWRSNESEVGHQISVIHADSDERPRVLYRSRRRQVQYFLHLLPLRVSPQS